MNLVIDAIVSRIGPEGLADQRRETCPLPPCNLELAADCESHRFEELNFETGRRRRTRLVDDSVILVEANYDLSVKEIECDSLFQFCHSAVSIVLIQLV